jgi:hypothetical protein
MINLLTILPKHLLRHLLINLLMNLLAILLNPERAAVVSRDQVRYIRAVLLSLVRRRSRDYLARAYLSLSFHNENEAAKVTLQHNTTFKTVIV